MAAVRYLFSIAEAVLMFSIDEMEEQPCLLLLLGVEKEEKSHFTPETRGWEGYSYRELGRSRK